MSTRYDLAIVGSGAAGISAAINAKLRNKNIIVFGSKDLSAKLIKAPIIDNYLGLPEITGKQLKDKFINHATAMGIEVIPEKINNVYAMGDYFALIANENNYEAVSVIIATGVEFSKTLPGEFEYLGQGVSYCATCDASFFKGKVVTVIGYNQESIDEANFISEIVEKTYFIPMFKGDYALNPNIEMVQGTPVSIKGTDKVELLELKDREITTDGVFILRDSVSPEQLVPGLEMEGKHIKVTRNMETNVAGLYAAGDISGKPYQYMKAAGEGQVATLNAVSFIDDKRKNI
ncbi:thioredoxin reductase [Acetobacterium paludosum]|uniref:Thioredoxin reductase n=1 Tax=Acetobacterium paludosum TaxID=52693 RepID=A0A923HU43_9FIRM|nr:NAD(P)/FAD-dependent oxidoreductase [Acetobacterium paludosum]MBC3887232.1 thioredoxin reductase [Acetobacterium paludosum]